MQEPRGMAIRDPKMENVVNRLIYIKISQYKLFDFYFMSEKPQHITYKFLHDNHDPEHQRTIVQQSKCISSLLKIKLVPNQPAGGYRFSKVKSNKLLNMRNANKRSTALCVFLVYRDRKNCISPASGQKSFRLLYARLELPNSTVLGTHPSSLYKTP